MFSSKAAASQALNSLSTFVIGFFSLRMLNQQDFIAWTLLSSAWIAAQSIRRSVYLEPALVSGISIAVATAMRRSRWTMLVLVAGPTSAAFHRGHLAGSEVIGACSFLLLMLQDEYRFLGYASRPELSIKVDASFFACFSLTALPLAALDSGYAGLCLALFSAAFISNLVGWSGRLFKASEDDSDARGISLHGDDLWYLLQIVFATTSGFVITNLLVTTLSGAEFVQLRAYQWLISPLQAVTTILTAGALVGARTKSDVQTARKLGIRFFTTSAVVGILLAVVGLPLWRIMFGAEAHLETRLLVLALVTPVFVVTISPFGILMRKFRLARQVLAGSVAGVAANLLLLFGLGWATSVDGVLAATAISSATTGVSSLLMLKKSQERALASLDG